MTADLVGVTEASDHTLLTLDDGKANALSLAMLDAIDDAVERALARRCPLVLAGRPGVFSGGFDLGVMTGDDLVARGAMVRAGFEVAYKLLAAPVPVVVACTGHAIAMGAFLLLSGDVNVGAAGRFRIGADETALGIVMPEFGVEIV
ncbi:MAG: enoyl-CoA hydratase-related protein, partial [Actinomycetota bacterium]